MHIFFVNNWSADTLLFTNYMVVLWTVAVEVQYYLIYPLIAKYFTKKPVLTYFIMIFIGTSCIFLIKSLSNYYNLPYYVNHFVTFIPVYANGMLASWLYILYTKDKKRTKISDLFFTLTSIALVIAYGYLCKNITGNIQEWQLNNRLLLSVMFTVFVISTLLSCKVYQKLFNNKLMKFIAVISFNLYIYHQFIAVKLKEFRIPFYSGDTPPNMLGDTKWQWTYTILCILISLIVAIIVTYLVEKPASKFIKKKFKCSEKRL